MCGAAFAAGSALGADWLGTDTDWANGANWSPAVPGTADSALFGATGTAGATVSAPVSVGSILFTADAPEYIFFLDDDFTVNGDIVNDSSAWQFFYFGDFDSGSHWTVNGGVVAGNIQAQIHPSSGATFDAADLGTLFMNSDGTVDLVNGSTAGEAYINNGGTLAFWDTSDAGTAAIQNTSFGVTEFHGDSSAAGAYFYNDGFASAVTFYDTSTAGTAQIENQGGSVRFYDDATAGDATIFNVDTSSAFRSIEFNDASTAGNATITTANGAHIGFYDSSTAGNATITSNGGQIRFQDTSSAGDATLIANSGGIVTFRLGSSGGNARLIANAGGVVEIDELNGLGTTAGSIEGAGDFYLGAKALTVGSNNRDTTVSGVISDCGPTGTECLNWWDTVTGGMLVKVGAGTLTLSGINTYTGGTVVSGGKLVVDGSVASAITLDGGTLGGSGDLALVTVMWGGAVAPGNSIGTINVTDVSFAAGSFYDVEVDALGNSDLILASGAATLAGGIVRLLPDGGVSIGTSYTILTATGGVSGAFDGTTSGFAFITPVLSYDANNVYLTVNRNSLAFADVAQTANQRAAAAGADGLAPGNPVAGAIVALSTAEAPAAFDALSGEAHAGLKGVFLDDDNLRRAALARVGQDAGFWGHVYGARGAMASEGNAAALDHSTGGFVAGADSAFGDWQFGLFANAGMTGFTIADRASSGDSTDYGLGLYGGTQWGDTGLGFGAAYARHDISTSRTAAFTGFSETLTAGYAAGTAQAFGELTHRVALGELDLTPFAGLAWVAHATEGFTEAGGDAALTTSADMLAASFTTLGVRAEQQFAAGDGGQLTMRGGLGWRHAFADLPTSGNAFAGGAAFTVAGAPVASDVLVFDAGLGMPVGDGALGLAYAGQAGPGAAAHALKATFAGRF